MAKEPEPKPPPVTLEIIKVATRELSATACAYAKQDIGHAVFMVAMDGSGHMTFSSNVRRPQIRALIRRWLDAHGADDIPETNNPYGVVFAGRERLHDD